jgi:hypothetical protein
MLLIDNNSTFIDCRISNLDSNISFDYLMIILNDYSEYITIFLKSGIMI